MLKLHSRADNGDRPFMVIWWMPLGNPIAWVAIQGANEGDVIEQAWKHPQAAQVEDEIVRRSLALKMPGIVTARSLPDSTWEGSRLSVTSLAGKKRTAPPRARRKAVSQ